MKSINSFLITVLFLVCVSMLSVSCSALKREISVTSPDTNQSPLSEQLTAAANISTTVLPPPYGQLLNVLLNLASTGASAFAVFHARAAKAAAMATHAAVTKPEETPSVK